MRPWLFFGGFAAWVLIQLVISSKAAEFRIDLDVKRDGGLGNDLDSIVNRLAARNYRPEGRRWYVVMLATQVLLIAWALCGVTLILGR